ncbi:MAG: hypothetical protein ACKO4Q_17245, partial [Planctomycetota bacterium]
DPEAAALELMAHAGGPLLSLERLEQAAARAQALRERLRSTSSVPCEARDARALAERLAERALRSSRPRWTLGARSRPGGVRLLDSIPAAETPEFAGLLAGLRQELAGLVGDLALLPVFCEARAGRGRYGLNDEERAAVEEAIARHREQGQPLALLWFGSPQSLDRRLWEREDVSILLAYAPTPPLVAAAGLFVARVVAGSGVAASGRSLPAELG